MTLKNPDKQNTSYHHGNLKQALVDAYLQLLHEFPVEKISLRKLASHVGVAATAVYNHFPDKMALVVAVKLECLGHFTRYLESHAPDTLEPEVRIRVLGQSYYRYSIEHAQYFERIFQEQVPDEYFTPELINCVMSAEKALRSAVLALLQKNNLPVNQYNEALGTYACWSMAHGITALASKHMNHTACASGRWPEEFLLHNQTSVNNSFEAMTEILIQGILVSARNHTD
ncbi:TetR/AcrR family transcriptional regulator [Teredinibacter waterburyi]|uniref:TetR/AcrR family transcriptional regulator n=1 Tax=Teredinibacter waterburyi TaxID=1500538 RepID=UPI00165F1ED8|nr:TetR/AcrR family transcriptional regulator [Teredinibacter waterburyi]